MSTSMLSRLLPHQSVPPAAGRAKAGRRYSSAELADGGLVAVRPDLFHAVGNHASCRVAERCGFGFEAAPAARPPAFPAEGHLHVRHRPTRETRETRETRP